MAGKKNLGNLSDQEIEALRRLKGSDMVSQQDSNGNLAVKLLRTFTAQTEALQRYRGKGQQKVTVEHVHVHTGGQAIVGSVSQSGGGRDSDENRGQPHAPENAGEPSRLRQAPRCLARTRRGTPCQSPAVAGKTVAECMAARQAVERRRGSAISPRRLHYRGNR